MTGGTHIDGAIGSRLRQRVIIAAALALVATTAAVTSSTPTVMAANPTSMPVIASYQMNESSSATVMTDSGPNNLNGTIGSLVDPGTTFDSATGYRFTPSSPTKVPADTERLVTVPDNDALDFGTSNFAIEFRYRSTVSWGNVVQKGQNQTPGGYFKFEQPKGEMTCLVKDADGDQIAARAPAAHATNDGDWHVIRCEKAKNYIRLFVDGVQVATTVKQKSDDFIESVGNNKVLSIGGKYSCNQAIPEDETPITCDYFNGQIDWLKIEKAGGAGSVNTPPTAAFNWSCDDRDCEFASGASNDPDGSIADRSWDFGDGTTGTGWSPEHTYDEGGTYTVRLTVTDNEGAIGVIEHDVTVNLPPVMSFTASCDELECTFDSAASADPDGFIASKSWKFGDGKIGSGSTPSHTFAVGGTYDVELTGTDDEGASATVTQSIVVAPNGAPTMNFTATCTNLACTFNSSASTDVDGTIVSRSWKFGDGGTATGTSPNHTYDGPGDYLVTLTGVDDDGAVGVTSRTIKVTEAVSNPPVPLDAASAMTAVTSFRAFDTRPEESPPGPKGVVEAGTSIDVQIAGVGPVPDGITAVAINLTVVALDAPSYVTAWPTGLDRPTLVSSVNVVTPNSVRANLAIVPVGDDGKISLFTLRDAHLLGDVVGYFTDQDEAVAAGRIVTGAPERLFDTRPGTDPGPKGLVGAGTTITVDVRGQAGLPNTGISAVILNLTATETQAAGFVTAWPGTTKRPVTSSLNINAPGETAANMVIVPVAPDGSIQIYSLSATHLLADVLGYVTNGTAAESASGLFVPLDPSRVFDTRPGEPAAGPKGLIPSAQSITTEIAGVGEIPDDAAAVVMNLTVLSTAPGFITMWPTGSEKQTTSNVNGAGAGDVRANGAILALGNGGDLDAYALTAAHLIGDVFGYLLS